MTAAVEAASVTGAAGAIEVRRAGRRFGRSWALRDVTLDVPAGAVLGLVGPNGAGKSTLLHLVIGLLRPTEGSVAVLGAEPGRPGTMALCGFVAQGAPLPPRLRVAEVLAAGRWLNPTWDESVARSRLAELDLDPRQRVSSLSGGQRAQLALATALSKRPRVVLLDEPVASLDPYARREFLAALLVAAVDDGITVVFSTHLISDLERACDHVAVIRDGAVRVAAPIDELLARHRVLVGPPGRDLTAGAHVLTRSETERQQTVLAHLDQAALDRQVLDPAWDVHEPSLEETVMAYLAPEPRAHRLGVVA